MASLEQIKHRKQVLDYILAHPEHHDQEQYFCGTTACIAGTAIMFDLLRTAQNVAETFQRQEASYTHLFDYKTLPLLAEFDYAGRLLGLDWDEAAALFYCWSNDEAVEMLRSLANEQPDY